ncbi:FctA domain-containing protein, partial [Mediterraneibacter gnavus]|uniref:FctA domain-containing protein n=1 Tax=Mediterraneibacter gnavus TaxID=33038 RepID=UPI001D03E9E8
GTQSLTGRTLKENDLSFEVQDAAGKKVAEGKNKADGTIRFGAISYSLSDLSDGNGSYVSSKEFTYTVSEVLPEGATAEN